MQNAAVLSILVNAKTGQATTALRKTQGQLKQTEKAAGRTGRGFKGLSSSAKFAIGSAAGAGILGLGAAAKSSVGAFREQQRVTRQTEAVLKSTGRAAGLTAKDISNLATELSKKTGIDDEAIQSTENLLLTFTKIKSSHGIFRQTTAVALDMSKALGQDFKSSAIQIGKALQDPIKGMTALRRVGVSFTQAQQDRVKGWVEEGKHIKAQKFILRELNTEFGGSAAKTATSADKLRVTLENISESIGSKIVPFIDRGAAALDKFITGMQEGTGAGGRFAATIKPAIASVGTFLTQNAQTFRDFGRVISIVFSAARVVVRKSIGGIMQMIRGWAQMLQGVIQIISGILTGDFGKVWDGVKNIFRGAINAIIGRLRATVGPFKAVAGAIGNAVGGVLGGAFRKVRDVVSGVVGSMKKLMRGLQKVMGDVIAGILRRFADMFDMAAKLPFVGSKFKGLADKARDAATKIDKMGEEIEGLPTNKKVNISISLKFSDAGQAVKDAFDVAAGPVGGSGNRSRAVPSVGKVIDDQTKEHVHDAVKANAKLIADSVGGAMGAPGTAKGALGKYERIGHSMGLVTSSGFRPGDPGWHGKNRARDIAGPAGAMLRFARVMFSRFGSNLLELIHTPMGKAIKNGQAVAPYAAADHYDHVHVAAAKGAAIKSHRATSPTVLFGEEAPRHPEYYISTNPRDKQRSMGLLASAAQEISGKRLAEFKKGGRRGYEFDSTTRSLGAIIRNTGHRVKAHRRFILAALTAAMTETGGPGRSTGIIRNPMGGDASSVGLFQMTDDKGSVAQRHDPAFASRWFYRTARQLSAPSRPLATIAQQVERSGYPGRYAQYADDAGRLTSELARSTRAGGGGAQGDPASPMSKRNRKILKRIPKRLKKIKGIGLSKKQEGWLKHLTALSANTGEWASRAGGLSSDTLQGKVGGHDEAYWLQQQLATLFQLRNTLIKYEALVVKKRERVLKMISSAHKFLHKLQRHPKQNKKLIEAYKKQILPALRKRRSGLSTRRGELLSSLEEVQGIASPMGLLKRLPAVGVLGGQIFGAQTRLRELGTKADVTDTSSTVAEKDTESADLLRQLLQQANLRTAVSERQFDVFKGLPYAGSFGGGGVVPGPVGRPMSAVVHGGESIGQPGNVSVQVFVHPGGGGADVYVNEKQVEAVVQKVNRKTARSAARGLPGGRG